MIKRNCFVIILLFVVGIGYPAWSQKQNKEKAAMDANAQAIRPLAEVLAQTIQPLAQNAVIVHRSEHPNELFVGSPSIVRLSGGRLVVSLDQFGPGVGKYCTGPIGDRFHFGHKLQGLVYTSDDGGATWTLRAKFPFCHARLFLAGDTLYLLGHKGNIMIMASRDGGINWTEPASLTDYDDTGARYTQAPANVLIVDGRVYLIMMYITDLTYRDYFVSTLALVAMRAPVDHDLCSRENWVISAPSKPFRELVPTDKLDYCGIPFYPTPEAKTGTFVAPGRRAAHIGWHEAHLVQIIDPNHLWFDKTGSSFHVLARADAHRSNMAALAVLRLQEDGSMQFDLQKTPAGTNIAFLPMPGGNIKFHVLFDDATQLYWLLSNQVTDSMTNPVKLPADGRYGLPIDQRERLVLHFSHNLVDWQFAGLVAKGKTDRESRHYASMAIDGEDLVVLSRSGDVQAKNAHDTNLITFHRVKGFRGLVY